jgi:hypothetical protein
MRLWVKPMSDNNFEHDSVQQQADDSVTESPDSDAPVVFRDGDIIPRGEDARKYRKAIREAQETGHDMGGTTDAEAVASTPHVHRTSEACEWWAEAFPQHQKRDDQ